MHDPRQVQDEKDETPETTKPAEPTDSLSHFERELREALEHTNDGERRR